MIRRILIELMERLHSLQAAAKLIYDDGGCPLPELGAITEYCLAKLLKEANQRRQATIGGKEYFVFHTRSNISRPYLPSNLLHDFPNRWKLLLSELESGKKPIKLDSELVNKLLYTMIMSFSVCYDLWKSTSRKTPGTYFEVLMGSALGKLLPGYIRTKHIPINETEQISTDIVFTKLGTKGGLVLPAKITTRERMVQPFAHQRILDSVFGKGSYKSVLLCVSETQRDGDDNVNEICVPGTVRLYQTHLASLTRIYYLDIPRRYLEKDITDIIPVGTIGQLLSSDITSLV